MSYADELVAEARSLGFGSCRTPEEYAGALIRANRYMCPKYWPDRDPVWWSLERYQREWLGIEGKMAAFDKAVLACLTRAWEEDEVAQELAALHPHRIWENIELG